MQNVLVCTVRYREQRFFAFSFAGLKVLQAD